MTSASPKSFVPRVFLDTPFRLSVVYVSLFCAAVAFTFIYVHTSLQTVLDDAVQSALQTDVETLQRRYQLGGSATLKDAVENRVSLSGDALLLLTDGSKQPLAGNLGRVSVELWNTVEPTSFTYRRTLAGKSVEREAYGTVLRFPTGERLIIARDVESREAVKRVMRKAFLFGYCVIALIGIAGGIFVSGRILRRVDAASNTARAIMRGDLGERIPVTGHKDEFDRLSQNLNLMLDRIEDLMTGLKDVSDNIAHDLKTPLHRLRTRAERALQSNPSSDGLRDALTSVIEEADALIKTFDALLSIARLESGSRDRTFGPLDICTLIRDVAELYEPAAEERGIKLRFFCGADIAIAGEKHLLGQAVANLLDNAIKYAAPATNEETGGALPIIDVSLEDGPDFVDIVVADRGPGVLPQDRERVLQRFVRLQPSRSLPGSGLGLSLVSAVARLHGGTVVLENNDPGLKVRLRIEKNMDDPSHNAQASMPRHAS